MLIVFMAGSWNWNISSVSTEAIYVSRLKLISERDYFGLQTVTEQTGPQKQSEQQYWSACV
jgi:hypothetical protein